MIAQEGYDLMSRILRMDYGRIIKRQMLRKVLQSLKPVAPVRGDFYPLVLMSIYT